MRSRLLSALLTAAVAGGVVGSYAITADAAGSARLFLTSKAGSYRADAMADPSSTLTGKAPAGSTLSPTAPSTATTATGDAIDPAETQPGLGVSFRVPVGLVVSTICLDVYVSGSGFDLGVYMQTGPPASQAGGANDYVTFDGVPVTGSAPINRVTAMAKIDVPASAGPTIKTIEGTSLVFSALHSVEPYTINYNSTTAPSSVIFNSPTCTPANFPAVAAAAPAAPTAAASASAAPSASASAAPSASASASAPASASAAPSASASASSSAPSSPGPSASATPNCPTASGSASASASGSASAAPSTSASAAPSTSASAAPSGSASAAPSSTASAAASSDPSASGSPSSGGSGVSSEASCRASSVSLTANVLQVTAGNSPTLSGVVRDSRGDAIEGATVTIFTKGYAESRYTAAATMQTDAAGQYRITVRPLKQTAYGVNVGNAKSPTINVRVSTRVNISGPAPSTVSNPVTFSGTLAPGYARVAVGLGYLTNGRFVVLKQADTNGTGGYTITSVLPRGTFAFVVFTSAHQGTDKGSKSVRLTVR